jgi:hypothetical protein
VTGVISTAMAGIVTSYQDVSTVLGWTRLAAAATSAGRFGRVPVQAPTLLGLPGHESAE